MGHQAVSQKLGRLLIKMNVITDEQLDAALEKNKTLDQPLGKLLTDLGYATQNDILGAMAKNLGLQFIDLLDVKPEPHAVAVVPKELAIRYSLCPVSIDDQNRLLVAMSDPQNIFAIDDLRIVTGYEILPAIATSESIRRAIDVYYQEMQEIDVAELDRGSGEDDDMLDVLNEIREDAPVVKLANNIMTKAIIDRASDIHIEPQANYVKVRYRIDGVMQEVMRAPKKIQRSLIARFKIMAEMDIADARRPQDGRCAIVVSGRKYDFRVSSLPTVHGERVVMRILATESILMDLKDLGFLPGPLERFEDAFTKPYGMVLVTGPTGSGKSTTLYAAINQTNSGTTNLITVEDPVEYQVEGLSQVQVNEKAGLTFASTLRSILRQDPDIVFVGEIRDYETAKTAIEAALTGHLVLSTLHTNDAASACTRLNEMGVEPFLTASSIDCVVAQRLARRLCPDCKVETHLTPEELVVAGYDHDNLPDFVYSPGGCTHCNGTGYKGRLGIHEVLKMTDGIRHLILEQAGSEDMKKAAIEGGMLTLKKDGLEKVRMGLTSIEEVLRVTV